MISGKGVEMQESRLCVIPDRRQPALGHDWPLALGYQWKGLE